MQNNAMHLTKSWSLQLKTKGTLSFLMVLLGQGRHLFTRPSATHSMTRERLCSVLHPLGLLHCSFQVARPHIPCSRFLLKSMKQAHAISRREHSLQNLLKKLTSLSGTRCQCK